MKIKKWFTINQRGSTRITQTKPGIEWDEISILLEVNLPDALFKKPRLEAKIDIPEEAARSDTLSCDVIENVKEAIEQSTGLTFAINVIEEKKEE